MPDDWRGSEFLILIGIPMAQVTIVYPLKVTTIYILQVPMIHTLNGKLLPGENHKIRLFNKLALENQLSG